MTPSPSLSIVSEHCAPARLARGGGASLIASEDAVVAFVSDVEPTCSTKTSSASRTAAAPAMSSALQTIGRTAGMPVTRVRRAVRAAGRRDAAPACRRAR